MIASRQVTYDYRGSAEVELVPNITVNEGERVYVLINSFTKEGSLAYAGDPSLSTVMVLVEPTQDDDSNIESNGYYGPEGRKGLKMPFELYLPNSCIVDPAGLISKVVKSTHEVRSLQGFMSGSISLGENWSDVAYGEGRFVAVAFNSDTAAYSDDGKVWRFTTLPASDYWYSVTYAGDRFVALGGGTMVAYSLDGVTWVKSNITFADWSDVTYGKGRLVAVSSGVFGMHDKLASYSDDGGVYWKDVSLPSDAGWIAVAYGNNKFVTVAYDSNKAAYSQDGITWTPSTIPMTDSWSDIVYGNGKFVAISYNGAYAVSDDGVSWQVSMLPVEGYYRKVAYGNGLFVTALSGSNISVYSSDGVNWETGILPEGAEWGPVGFGGDMFVILAQGYSIATYSIYNRTDNYYFSYFSPSMSNLSNVVSFGNTGYEVESDLYLSDMKYCFIPHTTEITFTQRDVNQLFPSGTEIEEDPKIVLFGGCFVDNTIREEGIFLPYAKMSILLGGTRADFIEGCAYSDSSTTIAVVFPSNYLNDNILGIEVLDSYMWKSVDIIHSKYKHSREYLEIVDRREEKEDLVVVSRRFISDRDIEGHLYELIVGNDKYQIPIATIHGLGTAIHPMGDLRVEGLSGRSIAFLACMACGENLYVHLSDISAEQDKPTNLVFDEMYLTPASDLLVTGEIKAFTNATDTAIKPFSGVVDLRRRSWYEIYLIAQQYVKSSTYRKVKELESQWLPLVQGGGE